MSDMALQEIEVLWARFKEERVDAPGLRIEEFAKGFPTLADEICRVFPLMRELEELADSESVDEVIPDSIGRYPIVRKIGVGGMGVVYEAQCDALRERIAIKVIASDRLDPKNIQRFEQEARAVAALHHTNIVPIYEFGHEDGKHFYTMRLVDGPNLADVTRLAELSEHDDFGEFEETDVRAYQLLAKLAGNWSLIAELGCQAAFALEHAHSKEVLHRDIKPANLLVDSSDKLWITDFGLAKRIFDDQDLTSIFQTVGTPRYMAPEQIKGLADHRSDIYSVGLTLYELVTLRPGAAPVRDSGSESPPSPRSLNSRIPVELDQIIAKAIKTQPSERYQSATELAADLRRCASHLKSAEEARHQRAFPTGLFAVATILAISFMLWILAFVPTNDTEPTTCKIDEGQMVVAQLDPEQDISGNIELSGADADLFRFDDAKRHVTFRSAADFEVPLDVNMDNVYEFSVARNGETLGLWQVHIQDVNEAPVLDEFLFDVDEQTLRLSRQQLSSAWTMDVADDRDKMFDGLFFSVAGGDDRSAIKMTPQGVFVFDPRLLHTNPIDANLDGVYEIDLAVADSTQVWMARLEERSDGSLALLRERVVAGAGLESSVISSNCLIRRDVIDIATFDGHDFYFIYRHEGRIGLGLGKLVGEDFRYASLSSDCGLPIETIGLATLDGKHFTAIARTRGETSSTKLLHLILGEDGRFEITDELADSGMPMSLGGFAWVDENRFHHVRRSVDGTARLYFSFLGGSRFQNMRLSESGAQYRLPCRGQAAWIEQADDREVVSRHIRIDTTNLR